MVDFQIAGAYCTKLVPRAFPLENGESPGDDVGSELNKLSDGQRSRRLEVIGARENEARGGCAPRSFSHNAFYFRHAR